MTEISENDRRAEAYNNSLRERIGLPATAEYDTHVIRPSTINAFIRSMDTTIWNLDVDERLRSYLRDAVATAFINIRAISHHALHDDPRGLYRGHLHFHIPSTIGELKRCAVNAAGYLGDAGMFYKIEAHPGRPEASARAPTNVYLSKMYRGLFDAFNVALKEEGFTPLERPIRLRSKAFKGSALDQRNLG